MGTKPSRLSLAKRRFGKSTAAWGICAGTICGTFFGYEGENEVVWARNDFVERMLGRKPVSVRGWLVEHGEVMLGK